jgi:hypothetical protein
MAIMQPSRNGFVGIVEPVILPRHDHQQRAKHGELGAVEAVQVLGEYADESYGENDARHHHLTGECQIFTNHAGSPPFWGSIVSDN